MKKPINKNTLNSSPKLFNNNYLTQGNNLNTKQHNSTQNNNSKTIPDTPLCLTKLDNKDTEALTHSPLRVTELWGIDEKPIISLDNGDDLFSDINLNFLGPIDEDIMQDTKPAKDILSVSAVAVNDNQNDLSDILTDHVFDNDYNSQTASTPCLPKKGPRVLYRKDSDRTGEKTKLSTKSTEKEDKSFPSVKINSGSMGHSCLTKAQLKMPVRKKSLSESSSTSNDELRTKVKESQRSKKTNNTEKVTNTEKHTKKTKHKVVSLPNSFEHLKTPCIISKKSEQLIDSSNSISKAVKPKDHLSTEVTLNGIKVELDDNNQTDPTEVPWDMSESSSNSILSFVPEALNIPTDTHKLTEVLNHKDIGTDSLHADQAVPDETISTSSELPDESFSKYDNSIFSNTLNIISPMNSPVEDMVEKPVLVGTEEPLDVKPPDNLPHLTEEDLKHLDTQSYSPPPFDSQEDKKSPSITTVHQIPAKHKDIEEAIVVPVLISPKKEDSFLDVPDERNVVPMDIESDEGENILAFPQEIEMKPLQDHVQESIQSTFALQKQQLNEKPHVVHQDSTLQKKNLQSCSREALEIVNTLSVDPTVFTQIKSQVKENIPILYACDKLPTLDCETENPCLKVKIPLHLIKLKDSTISNYKNRTSKPLPTRRKSIALENRVSPNLEDEDVDVECIDSPLKRKRKLSEKDSSSSDDEEEAVKSALDSNHTASDLFKPPNGITSGKLLVRINLSKLKRRPVKKVCGRLLLFQLS